MTDAIGPIGNNGHMLRGILPPSVHSDPAPMAEAGLKQTLHRQIEHVNAIQQDVKANLETIATDRRSGIESVLAAARQTEAAFEMLQQVRGRVLIAYQRIQSAGMQ